MSLTRRCESAPPVMTLAAVSASPASRIITREGDAGKGMNVVLARLAAWLSWAWPLGTHGPPLSGSCAGLTAWRSPAELTNLSRRPLVM